MASAIWTNLGYWITSVFTEAATEAAQGLPDSLLSPIRPTRQRSWAILVRLERVKVKALTCLERIIAARFG